MDGTSPLILGARIAGLVLPLSMITGVVLRSIQRGKAALRAGLAWGAAFALGMFILAMPGLVVAEIVYAWGWPRWIESLRDGNPDGFASMASTMVMLIGAGLAWSALPGLAELEKKWRGGR
jgi:hypothetical protein